MLAGFQDYIANEILAVEFITGNGETALDVNGSEIKVNVSRA
jgi:hypothetical protein